MHFSSADPEKPILVDSAFTQLEKLQLSLHPMGHFAASTFISHIWIPFNYSLILQLQSKLDERLDQFFINLKSPIFKFNPINAQCLNTTFELYKDNHNQIFQHFKDLLASLPHIPAREKHQWDNTSFVEATAALTLAT
jgi:hypothetical protein